MKAIGIDLGTTNSAVAYYDPDRGSATVLTNTDGENLTPSVVGLRRRDGQESVLVGRSAVNFATRQPADTIVSVKRLMGRDYSDPVVAGARDRLNYTVVPGPDDDPRAHVLMGGQTYAPAQVSSLILEKLRRDASRSLGEEVTHAVITVPAYFDNAQRAATREAGEKANLIVKKIIDEPTAAAIAFGLQTGQEGRHRVLVYDLGGGTFDISILHTARDKQGRGQFQVLSFLGDSWLGGDDFDRVIVDEIISWVTRRSGTDPSGDQRFLLEAKRYAEQAKRQLSQGMEADIIIPAAFRAEGGPLVDVEMTITREWFDEKIEPLVDRTMSLVRQALAKQDLTPEYISDVLLVGGATLTPKVYQTVEAFFGQGKVRRNINPMECVALGAGILAGTLQGVECPSCGQISDESTSTCPSCGQSLAAAPVVGEIALYERTGNALGIAAVKGTHSDTFVPIIPRDTPYPLREPMRRSFETIDGRRIRVPVYEGDEPVASRNKEVGVIEYELTEEVSAGTRVDVSFNYDPSRILTVTISVPGTKELHTATLRVDAPRTRPTTVSEVGDDEDARARDDLERTDLIARHFLEQYGQYLDPAPAMKLRRDLDQAQQALASPYADPAECRRIANLLQSDVFTSGLATQLFLAERATEGATAKQTQEINRAVTAIQASYQHDRRTAEEQGRVLRALLASTFKERDDIDEIADAEDYGGLLRLLDH
jgi:molecular chaperone DnaK (HSP70)